MRLRNGLNPDQEATASLEDPASPVHVVSGAPSYINVLDALGAWQLVRDAARALGEPAATSFKHLSPAGAAVAGDLDTVMEEVWSPSELSPITSAYLRARDCDPKSSFGDFVAVSEPVDLPLARFLSTVVSDGIVAPGFEPGTVEVLAAKKRGQYVVLEVDPSYEPPEREDRTEFGVRLEQHRSAIAITTELVASTAPQVPPNAIRDLTLAMITARYTQSNSITYARDGMVLGVGAGQQSRVDCTKLAGEKVDTWWLRRHHVVRSLDFLGSVRRQERLNWQIRYIEADLDDAERRRFEASLNQTAPPLSTNARARWIEGLNDVALASDAYIPFRDNVDHAARHGVRFLSHPAGSTRIIEVDAACAEHGIVQCTPNVRLFRH